MHHRVRMSLAAAQAECRDQPCRTQHSGQVSLEMSLARCQMRSQCQILHSAELSHIGPIHKRCRLTCSGGKKVGF